MLEIIKVLTVLIMAVPFVYMIVDVVYELVRTMGDTLSKNIKPVYVRIRRHPHK